MTELRGGNVDINVDGKTTVTGAVIAANADGELNLTTNELEYNDIHDFNTNHNNGVGLNTGFGIGTNKGESTLHPEKTTDVTIVHKGHDTEQTTHATIGAGNITVGGDTNPELAGLNRDIDNVQEITKDQVTGALDASVTVDNRIFTESGREQIAKQHEDFVDNIEQIGDGLRNNIVTKSIENAYTDKTKDIIDTIGDYIEQDRQMTELQEKRQDLVKALNGLTNYDSAEARDILQQVADFVAGTDGFSGDLHLASVDGNVIGFAYQSNDGSVKNISLNLANIDMTDPNALMNALYHETTNFEQHTNNEQTAKNRGDTGAGIFDLKNYGNENTNTMDNGQWLSNYGNSETIQNGSNSLVSDIINKHSGNGQGATFMPVLFSSPWTNLLISSDPKVIRPITEGVLEAAAESAGKVSVENIAKPMSEAIKTGAEQTGKAGLEGAGKSATDILFKNGKPIGSKGTARDVKTLPKNEFQQTKTDLLKGAEEIPSPGNYPGKTYKAPDGTEFGIRNSGKHGETIDVMKSPTGADPFRIHFK